MFPKSFTFILVCVLATSIKGKTIDLNYGYQEIEEDAGIQKLNSDETRHIEVDSLSDGTIETICRNFKVTIHVKDTDSFINCLDSAENSMKVMKRDVSEKEEEVEGSGESDTKEVDATVANLNASIEQVPPEAEAKIAEEAQQVPESPQSFSNLTTPTKTDAEVKTTELPPTMFKEGFDSILKNAPSHPRNTSLLSEGETHAEVADKDEKAKILLASSVGKSPQVAAGDEIAKIGESKEKPATASPNSALMLLFGGLGIIGILAFTFNYIKNRRDNKDIDEVLQLEAEGRELKEMKPLMKSPLSQNGARSLEYIDADPQEEIVTEVQVSNHQIENQSQSKE